MIVWLASYPRSGNTLLRVILNHIFGLKTWSLYNDTLDLGADKATADMVGHQFLDPNFSVAAAAADDERWLIKTHDYPEDSRKSIYIVRDGRETLTSYLFYYKNILKQEKSLSDLISGLTPFGSWSNHLSAWSPLSREDTLLLRFEDIVDNADGCIKDIATFLDIEPVSQHIPTFTKLQEVNPQFFRSGKNDTWKTVFSRVDHERFWELHGSTMVEYGYTVSATDWQAVRKTHPWSLVVTPAEMQTTEGLPTAKLPPDPSRSDISTLGAQLREHNSEIRRLRTTVALQQRDLERSDADRAARLAVIERQGTELGRIPALEADITFLKECLIASDAEGAQLKKRLIASEADRAARLAVIERQGAELGQIKQILGQLLSHLDRRRRELLPSLALPASWQSFQDTLQQARRALQPSAEPSGLPLADYVAEIDRFNRSQPNPELLTTIRDYNHQMVDTLDGLAPLRGVRLLDIGASPHGYALERALALGAAEYVGIGLDVDEPIEVRAEQGIGRLFAMDATQLAFPDASFDLVISISTFEHIGDVPAALAEIRRVLRPGGKALITFEPIWTCAYGHHLHHFGPIARHMPDWAHLVWDKLAMLRELADVWPADGAPTLAEAANWVYDSPALNRIGLPEMRQHLAECGLCCEWILTLPDTPRDPARLQQIAQATGYSPDDLTAKGISLFLAKEYAKE